MLSNSNPRCPWLSKNFVIIFHLLSSVPSRASFDKFDNATIWWKVNMNEREYFAIVKTQFYSDMKCSICIFLGNELCKSVMLPYRAGILPTRFSALNHKLPSCQSQFVKSEPEFEILASLPPSLTLTVSLSFSPGQEIRCQRWQHI